MKIDIVSASAQLVSIKMSLITIWNCCVCLKSSSSLACMRSEWDRKRKKKTKYTKNMLFASYVSSVSLVYANWVVRCCRIAHSTHTQSTRTSNYVMKQSKPIQACNFIYCWNDSNIFIFFFVGAAVRMFVVAAFHFLLFCFCCSFTFFFLLCSSLWMDAFTSQLLGSCCNTLPLFTAI